MECIFCKIVDGKIPVNLVDENSGAIAFLDNNPISNGHTIVIPKKHYKNLSECDKDSLNDVFDLVQKIARNIYNSSLDPWGINYLSNDGTMAGQIVMHFHVHIIPKYSKSDGLKIGVGTKYLYDIKTVYEILKTTK